MSINKYSTISLPETFQHPTIQRVHLNDNQITEWVELAKLSHAFPSLHTLIACSNPIREIPELSVALFPSLQCLNLTNSALCTWASLEHLQALGKLEDLSVMKVPLGKEMAEKNRRKAFVARLPKIAKLNKSVVTEREREAAERWLIRDLQAKPDQSAFYQALVEKHGELKQLADIDLSPPKTMELEFHFDEEERPAEKRKVVLKQTIWEFKTWVGKNLLSMPPSRFRLLFDDKGWANRGLLQHNQRTLYSYRFSEETEIHIQMK